MTTPIVYLNGHFVPVDDARISPFDRGFLFAQAAYEVTAVYNGQLIDFDAHLARLGPVSYTHLTLPTICSV